MQKLKSHPKVACNMPAHGQNRPSVNKENRPEKRFIEHHHTAIKYSGTWCVPDWAGIGPLLVRNGSILTMAGEAADLRGGPRGEGREDRARGQQVAA